MAKQAGGKVLIVKKIKKGHGGHHGGSWKVAYADFVTAMMAFFMVMWILGMDQNLRKAIEGYFSNPIGFKKGYSAGQSPLSAGASPATVKTEALKLMSRADQARRFEQASASIKSNLAHIARVGGLSARVEVIVTTSGLRIELIEGNEGNTFFALASAEMTPAGRAALEVIGQELATLDNPLIVEGHTDAAQYGRRDYTNWELSTDRANAARRVLEGPGRIPLGRIKEIKGLADRELRVPSNPLDPTNRRISILLPFVVPPDLPSLGAPPARTDTVAAARVSTS
jgi:chemotaxis protein MotB